MNAKELGLKSIMICGPIHDDVASDMDNFDFYVEAMVELGFEKVFNPMAVIYGEDKKLADKPNNALCSDDAWDDYDEFLPVLMNLPYYEAIYLMPNWFIDNRCWMIVSTAALLKMTVLMHDNNEKLVTTNAGDIIEDAGEYDPSNACPCGSIDGEDYEFQPEGIEDVSEEELWQEAGFFPGCDDDAETSIEDRDAKDWFERQFGYGEGSDEAGV
jgi:hypothetical protein